MALSTIGLWQLTVACVDSCYIEYFSFEYIMKPDSLVARGWPICVIIVYFEGWLSSFAVF